MRTIPRVMTGLLAASMPLAMATGCGESAKEQEAHITGFAQGLDIMIYEQQWVHYEDQDRLPSGTVRNIDTEDEFDGCKEVSDDFFGWNMDDSECWQTFCSGGEGTHCEAQYKKVYDYDREEEVEVRNCPAPMRSVEYKSNDQFIDQACLDSAQPHQRVTRSARFMIYISTANPAHTPDTPNEPTRLYSSTAISQEQWQDVSRESNVTAIVRDNRVVDVRFNG